MPTSSKPPLSRKIFPDDSLLALADKGEYDGGEAVDTDTLNITVRAFSLRDEVLAASWFKPFSVGQDRENSEKKSGDRQSLARLLFRGSLALVSLSTWCEPLVRWWQPVEGRVGGGRYKRTNRTEPASLSKVQRLHLLHELVSWVKVQYLL